MSIPSFSLLPASATRTPLCPARLIASQAKADEGGTLSFVTENEDTLTLVAAIRRATQAAGFISKDEAAPALVDAIRRAARGEVLCTEKQLVRVDRWRRDVGRRWESLTESEHEVLRLLIEGWSSAAVAEELGLAEKTVEYHVTNTLSKLGFASRLEAAVWVHRHVPHEVWDDG